MQWLHFVNELGCYKGKENKKQLLNIIQGSRAQSRGGESKTNYMPEKYSQNKEFTWVSRFFLFRSSYKIFKKKVLGTPPQ